MVTIRISDECGVLLKKMAEKARRSLCKQVEAMILSQRKIFEEKEYKQAWIDAESKENLIDSGEFVSFEDTLTKLGL